MPASSHHACMPLPAFLTSALPNRSLGNTERISDSSRVFNEDDDADSIRGRPREQPRSYQLRLLEEAQRQNIIVILDTGTGKTLIASLLIKHYVEMQLRTEKSNANAPVSLDLALEFLNEDANRTLTASSRILSRSDDTSSMATTAPTVMHGGTSWNCDWPVGKSSE